MTFCQSILNDAVDLLTHNTLAHKNSILLGDNSSGKSEILRKVIVKRLEEQRRIYYLDAVNRYFDVSKVSAPYSSVVTERDIVETRIKPDYFNLVDSFTIFKTVTDRVELIYHRYEKKVQDLLNEFIGIHFEMTSPERKLVSINGSEGKLSSGLQALVRVFLELTYLQDVLKEEQIVVVIDELDEFLSPVNSGKILPFLVQHFENMEFIVSTHSADMVKMAEDCNIIIVYSNVIEVIDSNDFNTDAQIRSVFRKVFGESEHDEGEVDTILRILLNNKISGTWSQQDQKQLSSLKEKELSNAQKVLYRQIKEW